MSNGKYEKFILILHYPQLVIVIHNGDDDDGPPSSSSSLSPIHPIPPFSKKYPCPHGWVYTITII